jgi:hydrogenase maturation protein HypF
MQHHHAHVASVMAEHDLQGPVIGVSFDGTGYGTDGAIWGGEFLLCGDTDFRRVGHLEYIRMLGGDASMKEGWKSALSYVYHYKNQNDPLSLRDPEDTRWPTVKAGLDHNINTINSSSMGRLFDAVAAFAGIHDYNRYEGECAIMLENAAAEAVREGLKPWNMAFKVTGSIISAAPIFQSAEDAMSAGIDSRQIALGFHYAVADMILEVCGRIRQQEAIDSVALTGGVFQNKILMERTLELLRSEGFKPYYNISVGPNDGGVCLGQNLIGMKYLTKNQHNDNIK